MESLNSIPSTGWVVIGLISMVVLVVLMLIICGVFILLWKKNIKTKFFEINEIKPEIKERYIAEGKDLVDNQSQVAKLLIKGWRAKLYEIGLRELNITNQSDKIIFELITYRISDRLNYELKNDFTRNHITSKSNAELDQYTSAKSKAYYALVRERLYIFNDKLPQYNLPDIMTKISYDETKDFFGEIYKSARDIAGWQGEKNA
jgi:hypothetical protein